VVVLRRHRGLIVGVAGVALVLAALYSFLRTPVYSSKAEVLVRPITSDRFGDAARTNDLVSLETEREVVLSSTVADLAVVKLVPPDQVGAVEGLAESLLEHVAVEIPPDSQVLEIVYSDTDPVRAQQGAQAFADSYLEFKTKQALDASLSRSQSIQQQIAELENQVREENKKIAASAPGSAEQRDAQLLRDVLTGQIAVLRNGLVSVTTTDIDPGEVISAARRPRSPSSPKHVVNLGLGLFLGLISGVALAFFRDRMDDRLRGRLDLERAAGAPVLAVVPKLPWKDPDVPTLMTVEEPGTAVSEAYRRLRTSILMMARRRQLKSLIVVSALEKEGKSTTAANLCVVLAQTGKRVLLVSADLRRPRVHEFFGLPNEPGLTDLLSGVVPATDAFQKSGVDNLWVLPSGRIAQQFEPLESEKFRRLLEGLNTVDFVVIDCPPVLAVADSLALAPHVDGVLLVADAEKSTRAAVIQARDQLEQAGGELVGAVLSNLDPSKTVVYYYYQGSGYRSAAPVSAPERTTIPEESPRQDVVIAVSEAGNVKRLPLETYRRGGKDDRDARGPAPDAKDVITHVLTTTNRSPLLLFTNTGRIYRAEVHEVPDGSPTSQGVQAVGLPDVALSPRERLVAVIPLKGQDDRKHLIFATRHGLVKKTDIREYDWVASGLAAVSLRPGDELREVKLLDGEDDIILVSRSGLAIRFAETEAREVSRPANGVIGMRLAHDDEIIAMGTSRQNQEELVTITESGFGKRTSLHEYPRTGRGGKGVFTHKLNDKTGRLAGAFVGSEEQDVFVISESGAAIRVPAKDIRRSGRLSQGAQVTKLDDNQKIAAVVPVINDDD
jgi:capsular exopolysaccharide synthesis family protein